MSVWTDPTIYTYWYLRIEGIPQLLCSHVLPAAWFPGAIDWIPLVALDVSDGLDISGQQLNRKGGASSPNQRSFRIGPDDAPGTLRTLFATRKASTLSTRITASVVWGDAAITVTSTAGWPAAGIAHMGPACFTYNGLAGGQFLNVVWGAFDSEAWACPLDTSLLGTSRYITSDPPTWEGRSVKLYRGVANATGQPLDAAFAGPHQRQVWRGRISSLRLADDMVSWTMDADSIDVALDTEVAGRMASGLLAWTGADNLSPMPFAFAPMTAWVMPGANMIKLQVRRPGSVTYADVIETPLLDAGGGVPPYPLMLGKVDNLWHHIGYTICAALEAFYAPLGWTGFYSNVEKSGGFGVSEGTYSVVNTKVVFDFPAPGVAPGWAWRMVSDDQSLLRAMGYLDHYVEALDAGVLHDWYFLFAADIPALYVSRSQTSIMVREDVQESGASFITGSTGWALIRHGDTAEILYYANVIEEQASSPRIVILSQCSRGRCGTAPIDMRIEFGEVDEASGQPYVNEEPPTAKQAIAFEDQGILTCILKMAIGGTGGILPRHPTLDTVEVPEWNGALLLPEHFDIPGWRALDTALASSRNLAFVEPVNLKSWASAELACMGCVLLCRRGSGGQFQIGVERVRDPIFVAKWTIDSSSIVVPPVPQIRSSIADTINRVSMSLCWNTGLAKAIPFKTILNDVVAQVDAHNKIESIALEARGAASTPAQALSLALPWGASILSHFARRYEIVSLDVRRTAWQMRPGDWCLVTLAGIPQSDGTLGWNQEPMLILGVTCSHAARGDKPPARLTLLHLPGRKLSLYVPSARINAWGAAPNTITVDANYYTDAGQESPLAEALVNDVDFWDVGHRGWIRRPGEEATYEAGPYAVLSKAGQVLELDAAVPVWLAAGDVLVYADYDAVAAAQQRYAYIADNNALLGAANAPAFQFAG